MSEQQQNLQVREQYWRDHKWLLAVLLSIWFCVTFAVVFFARELSALQFFGFPFSFYMAAQGSMLVYVLVTLVYAMRMNRLEERYHLSFEPVSDQPRLRAEEEDDAPLF